MTSRAVFVLFLVIGVISIDVSSAASVKMTPEFQKCFQTVGITDSVTQQRILDDGNFRYKEQACFLKCMLENDGLLGADGKITREGATEIASRFDKTLTDEQVAKCQKQADESSSIMCESALAAADCIATTLRS